MNAINEIATVVDPRCKSDELDEKSEAIRYAIVENPLGRMLVACSAQGVCAILLGDNVTALKRELRERLPHASLREDARGLAPIVMRANALLETPVAAKLDAPLDIRGTPFQRRVWQALREIRPGSTASYTQIARHIGAPKSARAVAQACAANPLAVAIPCHRVVHGDGTLSGYRWGVQRKRALLQRESQAG